MVTTNHKLRGSDNISLLSYSPRSQGFCTLSLGQHQDAQRESRTPSRRLRVGVWGELGLAFPAPRGLCISLTSFCGPVSL